MVTTDLPDFTQGIDIYQQTLAEVVIPHLNNLDRPHLGLPYDSKRINITDIDVADGDSLGDSLTDTDWGIDQDFYLYIISVLTSSANRPFNAVHAGLVLEVYIHTSNEYVIAKTITNSIVKTAAATYRILKTYIIPNGYKILNSDTLDVGLKNSSGVTLDTILVSLNGVII